MAGQAEICLINQADEVIIEKEDELLSGPFIIWQKIVHVLLNVCNFNF